MTRTFVSPRRLDRVQQRADSRSIHLDAETIPLRMALRRFEQRVAHAEADLQRQRRRATEVQRSNRLVRWTSGMR